MIRFFPSRSRSRRIYADWAATAPIHPEVRDAMASARRMWANPSSIYREGVEAKHELERIRASVARRISAKPEDIIFTSGGTEANNTIIRGIIEQCLAEGAKLKDIHIVSTQIEHSSVLEPIRMLAARGVKVTLVAPRHNGIVDADDVLAAIKPNTVLVSCMLANNEIGTIQPISKIGTGLRALRAERFRSGKTGEYESAYPVFHVDACQAPLWLPCDMEGLRADAMTLDGHKMRGPKGVGALIVRHHIPYVPLLLGGGQERGYRSTTESLELAAGFARAFELACTGRSERARTVARFRDRLETMISTMIPDVEFNGTFDRRLPNNLNISLPHISDPEFTVIKLDEAGIACSTKSSCLKGEDFSYVIEALERARADHDGDEPRPWVSRNTLRFTLGPAVSEQEITAIARALKTVL